MRHELVKMLTIRHRYDNQSARNRALWEARFEGVENMTAAGNPGHAGFTPSPLNVKDPKSRMNKFDRMYAGSNCEVISRPILDSETAPAVVCTLLELFSNSHFSN